MNPPLKDNVKDETIIKINKINYKNILKLKNKNINSIFLCIVFMFTMISVFYCYNLFVYRKDMKIANLNYRSGEYNNAFKIYKLYAENGDIIAQGNLGRMYLDGKGVEKNIDTAIKFITNSANNGSINDQFRLCVIYYDGQVIDKDYYEAYKWCTKASENGDILSRQILARMYIDGNGVDNNYKYSIELLQNIADKGDMFAQYDIGIAYYAIGKFIEAKTYFEKSAYQGLPDSQFNLAAMYLNGDGVDINYGEASNWFKKASAQGNIKATQAIAVVEQKNYEYVNKMYDEKYSLKNKNKTSYATNYETNNGYYSVTNTSGIVGNGYVGSDGFGNESAGSNFYVDPTGRNFISYDENTNKTIIGKIGSDGSIQAVNSSGKSFSGIMDANGKMSITNSSGYTVEGNVNLY